MKKVLIGLLVLAVAGGGVFAQEWRFQGDMWAGLGIWLTDHDDSDDQYIGVVSNERDGMRSQLTTTVNNADNTAGLNFRFRADGSQNVNMSHGFGWISFMENMFTLYGGDIDDAAGFNSFDRMTGARMGEGHGLRLLVRPMDNLAISLGAYTGREGWMNLDGANNTQAKYTFAVRFDEPDLFRVIVGMRNTNEVGRGFDGWRGNLTADSMREDILADFEDGYINAAQRDALLADLPGLNPGGRTQASAAYLSFEYLGLAGDGIHLAASAFFQNLEEFSDFGSMHFYASFGHTGLVEGMNLGLGVGLSLSNAHDDMLGGAYTPHIWVWGSVEYQLTDSVFPRLDLHYVRGGVGSGEFANMHNRNFARGGAVFHEDASFMRVQPSAQFRFGSNTFIELGCVVDLWLGDSDWVENNVQFGAYALMRVSF